MSDLLIETPPAFSFRTTLLSHGWIELKPFAAARDYTALQRVERFADGTVAFLTVRENGDGGLAVTLDGATLTPGRASHIRSLVRRMFNLRLDLRPFYRCLEGHDRYAWVAPSGAGRLLRAATVWEDLAKTLLTTNTTWSMTKAMVARLAELGDPFGGFGFAFPEPERVAALSVEALDAQVRAGYRSAYLHELACAISNGSVDVESWNDAKIPSSELYRRIRQLKGFGPYAAGSMLKLLGYFDELAIDSAVRSMFKRDFLRDSDVKDAAIEAHYEPFGTWKGLVVWMDLMRSWIPPDLQSTD